MTAYVKSIQDHLAACRLDNNKIFLPDYQIPAGEFPQVKRAIEGIGGKWATSEQAYVFQSTPDTLFQRICAGETINLERTYRKKTQFFWTPKAVLDIIEQYIFIARGERMLEPSAGRGAIASYFRDLAPNYEWQLDCCEMDPENREILQDKGFNLVGSDFMEMPRPERGYHIIVANPPFSNGQDIQHFNRMYSMLAPGGRMAVIMSTGWKASEKPEAVELREWLNYFFHEVVDLPRGSFREAGTNIDTCLVILDKPLDEEY